MAIRDVKTNAPVRLVISTSSVSVGKTLIGTGSNPPSRTDVMTGASPPTRSMRAYAPSATVPGGNETYETSCGSGAAAIVREEDVDDVRCAEAIALSGVGEDTITPLGTGVPVVSEDFGPCGLSPQLAPAPSAATSRSLEKLPRPRGAIRVTVPYLGDVTW